MTAATPPIIERGDVAGEDRDPLPRKLRALCHPP